MREIFFYTKPEAVYQTKAAELKSGAGIFLSRTLPVNSVDPV